MSLEPRDDAVINASAARILMSGIEEVNDITSPLLVERFDHALEDNQDAHCEVPLSPKRSEMPAWITDPQIVIIHCDQVHINYTVPSLSAPESIQTPALLAFHR